MRLLVVASIFRHLDNIADALRRVTDQGGAVHFLLTPFLNDTGVAKLMQTDYGEVHLRAVQGSTLPLWQQNFPLEEIVERIVALVGALDIHAVLITQTFPYPWHALRSRLMAAGLSAPIIACQQGLVEPWGWGAHFKTCDYFFAFSERHAELARPTVVNRAIVAGFPKLDRVRELDRSEAGTDVLVLSSPMIHVEHDYQNLIEALPAALRRRVYLRGHPMYPQTMGAALAPVGIQRALDYAQNPLPSVLERTGLAIGAHSTALLESMVAGVPTVVLPARRYLDAYPDYPATAATLTTDAVVEAEQIALNGPDRIREYLSRLIRIDVPQTDLFIGALNEVVAS